MSQQKGSMEPQLLPRPAIAMGLQEDQAAPQKPVGLRACWLAPTFRSL